MIRNTRWFLFIEWWVGVIAIVGVLSAALFPSMTGYLQRSRDAARMSHINDISISLGAYYVDKERYPSEVSSGCIPQELIEYMPRWIPVDPSPGRLTDGCDGTDGMTYAYRSPVIDMPVFLIGADMETEFGWNSYQDIDELIQDISGVDEIQGMFVRWSGPHYILSN